MKTPGCALGRRMKKPPLHCSHASLAPGEGGVIQCMSFTLKVASVWAPGQLALLGRLVGTS